MDVAERPAAAARALVTGSAGYIGSRLVAALAGAGAEVTATARRPRRLDAVDFGAPVRRVGLDVDDPRACAEAIEAAGPLDAAYYLVHAIGEDGYARTDRRRAETFARAARRAGVARVVYLGGLVPRGETLSEHLASRAEVGEVLAEHGPELVDLRAAVILGAGSASYEIIRYLGDWLPVVPLPPSMDTMVQPVAVDDVLRYLLAAPGLAPGAYDLGGPERVPYGELVRRYLRVAGLRRVLVPTPPVPPWLASWVVSRLTPVPREMVGDLVLSLVNTMVTGENRITELVPGPTTTIDDALARARVGSHLGADRLPTPGALRDPLRLCRTDAPWSRRR